MGYGFLAMKLVSMLLELVYVLFFRTIPALVREESDEDDRRRGNTI